MFKKSDSHSQLDLFSSPTEYFRGSKKKEYLKDGSWHNLFRKEVVMRVDENIFSVLYSEGNGSPNASIRVLVGMMILKEGQGWSDRQLFSECGYNLLTRSALGLMSLEDAEPVPSTYYLFRRNLVEHEKEHGVDLFKECQSRITRDQALEFNVEGKRVRMDSKLVGSNIAWYSRYELIHETLRLFIAEREEHIFKRSLSKEMFSLIESIRGETGNKVVYRSTKEEVDARFLELGKLMYLFINLFKKHDYGQYGTLKAVFEQQYTVSREKVVLPLEKEKVSAKSIQSPHDTDCHYRDKDGNKVKGYSVNITETCDQAGDGQEAALNLVTDTRVTVCSAPDNGFFQQALEQTREVITGEIEKVHADGAYNSAENREYCQGDERDIDMVITAIQGAMPRYDIRPDEDDDNNLIVIDNKTGELVQSYPVKPRGDKTKRKWRIKTGERKYRYFDEENLRVAGLRRKLKDIPPGESCLRNNVEATIFQLGYHYPDDKSRYRTLAKHKLWAYSRSLWINFVRIANYTTRTCQRALSGQKTSRYMTNLCFNMHIIVNKFIFNKNNQNCPAKSLFSAI